MRLRLVVQKDFVFSTTQFQCATSLAATFDEQLIREAGEFLAEETKIKSSVILLAPTCNIQRSPLGGRAFESFSEDPHLSGMSPVFSSPNRVYISSTITIVKVL